MIFPVQNSLSDFIPSWRLTDSGNSLQKFHELRKHCTFLEMDRLKCLNTWRCPVLENSLKARWFREPLRNRELQGLIFPRALTGGNGAELRILPPSSMTCS
jgi:hypothetical protein